MTLQEKFDTRQDYLRKNFYWCIFGGFALQCVGGSFQCLGGSMSQTRTYPPLIIFGWAIYLAGTALLLIGFAFYAKSKGRNPVWSLLALASIIGWVILIFLKPKNTSTSGQDNSKIDR